MNTAMIIWIVLFVAFVVIEVFTPTFFFLSLAIGSLFAALTTLIFDNPPLQVAVFLLFTIISFLIIRKVSKKAFDSNTDPTNIYGMCGQIGIVTKRIEPGMKGYIKIRGEEWSAVSEDYSAIDTGDLVTIIKIDGNKAIVRRQQGKELLRQTAQLTKTRDEEDEHHTRIKESIDYASLIQRSILPPSEKLTKAFADNFVIWKPRDKVGGDFYWLHNIDETGEILFAVIDCTGHGVPGALISMSVYSLLNNIVKERKIYQPADILNNIHKDIGSALHQESGHSQQDGLDMSLVKINKEKQTLTFAGAALHLIYYDGVESSLKHIKGSKHSIGGLKWQKKITFEQLELPYSPNAILYLYSDGIIDQLFTNKERRVRFGHPRWLELLNGIYTQPFPEQSKSIEEKLNELLSCYEQRDDITIVAIKA